jgi:hypothetical protein
LDLLPELSPTFLSPAMRTIFALLLFLFSASCNVAWGRDAVSVRPTSEFTSSDPAQAQLLERTESGTASYLCAGRGKYRVILQTAEGRSWLDLLAGETVVSLARETFEACAGANPKKADAVVEWRGTRKGKQFVPFALVYRVSTESRIGKGQRQTVVVVKLDGPQSRVIGQVSGDSQKDAAHELADRLCFQK